ncbi:hypothetical protein Tco_1263651 [Tanacetum coccineum]
MHNGISMIWIEPVGIPCAYLHDQRPQYKIKKRERIKGQDQADGNGLRGLEASPRAYIKTLIHTEEFESNLEIDKLADEYELGIGKKGHILDNIWEYCNQVHNKNYEWHNYEFENEECEEIGIEDKDYHPPEVQVETFEVKKYSFKGGQSFICVTKDLDNILPLGRKNGSKFKEMIRKEVENNKT